MESLHFLGLTESHDGWLVVKQIANLPLCVMQQCKVCGRGINGTISGTETGWRGRQSFELAARNDTK